MPRRLASRTLLTRFQDEIERLFQEALELAGSGGSTGPAAGPSSGRWQPRLDIVESDASVELIFEVPGLGPEQLEVEVQGGEIRVRGSRGPRASSQASSSAHPPESGAASDGTRFLCVEREHGTFERRVKLFWPVNSHRGRAWLDRGLLILQLPKIEERRQRSRTLEIAEAPPDSEPGPKSGSEGTC